MCLCVDADGRYEPFTSAGTFNVLDSQVQCLDYFSASSFRILD